MSASCLRLGLRLGAQTDHDTTRPGLLEFVAQHHAALGSHAERFVGGQARLSKAPERVAMCSAGRQWQASTFKESMP